MTPMTRTERLLRLARQRGDRAAELILLGGRRPATATVSRNPLFRPWTEAELRAAWGDR